MERKDLGGGGEHIYIYIRILKKAKQMLILPCVRFQERTELGGLEPIQAAGGLWLRAPRSRRGTGGKAGKRKFERTCWWDNDGEKLLRERRKKRTAGPRNSKTR